MATWGTAQFSDVPDMLKNPSVAMAASKRLRSHGVRKDVPGLFDNVCTENTETRCFSETTGSRGFPDTKATQISALVASNASDTKKDYDGNDIGHVNQDVPSYATWGSTRLEDVADKVTGSVAMAVSKRLMEFGVMKAVPESMRKDVPESILPVQESVLLDTMAESRDVKGFSNSKTACLPEGNIGSTGKDIENVDPRRLDMMKQLRVALDGLDGIDPGTVPPQESTEVSDLRQPANQRMSATLSALQSKNFSELRSTYEQRIREHVFPAMTTPAAEHQRVLSQMINSFGPTTADAVEPETSQLDQDLREDDVPAQTIEGSHDAQPLNTRTLWNSQPQHEQEELLRTIQHMENELKQEKNRKAITQGEFQKKAKQHSREMSILQGSLETEKERRIYSKEIMEHLEDDVRRLTQRELEYRGRMVTLEKERNEKVMENLANKKYEETAKRLEGALEKALADVSAERELAGQFQEELQRTRIEMLRAKQRKEADSTEKMEELVLQIEGLKKDVCLEKDVAAGLRKLCDELEAQAASHSLLDKQLRDLCEHRTGLLQKLEGELSEVRQGLAVEKERAADLQAENQQLQREIASMKSHDASTQNELRALRDELALEKGENKHFSQELERLSEENATCRGSFESAQKLREELEVERGTRRTLERQCAELQELGHHRETVIKQFESSFENVQKGLKLAEDEVAFHRKELEMTKMDMGQEKQRSAQFEVALEEQRTLLVRLESAMEQAHVDLTRVKMELQQSQWDLKCENEKAEYNELEMKKVREASKELVEKSRLEAEKASMQLKIQVERQAELERSRDDLEMQLAAKVDIEAQFTRVKEQQDDLLKQLEADLEQAHTDAMEERTMYVTKQTALLTVQRELEKKCEGLETTATGESSEAATALSELRQSLNTTTEKLKATQAELEKAKNAEVRQPNEQFTEEQQCQELLDLVMNSTQRLLGQKSAAHNVVDRYSFARKFKEAVDEIEKLLGSSVEQTTFIGEGEATLDELKRSVDSMAQNIQKAGEMQACLVEQLSQTQCQLVAEKENSAALGLELDEALGRVAQPNASQLPIAKICIEPSMEGLKYGSAQQSKVVSAPSQPDSRRPSMPSTPLNQDSRRPTSPSSLDSRRPSALADSKAPSKASSVKATPLASPTASIIAKSKTPSGSGAKTPGRQSLLSLLAPGKGIVKAVSPAKAVPAKKAVSGKAPGTAGR